MKSNNLTIKQEAFCQAYVLYGDKSKAYREVYNCSRLKDKSIWELSSKLSTGTKVASRIEELQAKVAAIAEKKFEITHQEILNHLNILRNSRIDEYVEIKRNKLVFKDFDKLTKEQLMCIESIRQDRYGNIEIKLHGKDWSIDKINKHIGFYALNNNQKQPIVNIDTGGDFNEDKAARLQELMDKANKALGK
jgi:phage terminase small subunit